MSISDPFISRPIATSLVAVAMVLGGAVAFVNLPISPLPKVDFPTIQVSAGLPGGSPETMASSVATPLERRFGRIAGLAEMTSSNTLGSTNITLQFDLDRDVDSAARDVQAAISAAGGELPPQLPSRPTYRKVNPSDAPIIIISMRSKTLLPSDVYDVANNIVAQKMSQVPGVGQVSVGGGQQPAVRMEADTIALAAKGIGLEEMRAAMAVATADEAKGQLSNATQAQTLAANDQLMDAAHWKGQTVVQSPNAIVRMSDVSRVWDGVQDTRASAWADQERTIALVIRRQPGANIIDTIERVKASIPILKKMISPSIEMVVTLDRAQTIRGSVADVEFSLVLSVLLVVLVVFAFLRSIYATIVPSIAVPLSLIATFGVMYILGYSLDNLSLMALTVSTGFVVDDAVVVTENIMRLHEAGMPAIEAARKGAKQIGFTIISITCSLLAVFIPILFMGGIVGRLFRELAVTLSVAIGISALVSLTITPSMSAQLLGRAAKEKHGKLGEILEKGYTAIEQGYAKALRFVLARRVIVGIATILTVAVTVGLYIVVPKGLFPQQDTGTLMGTVEASQDISFPAMRDLQMKVNAIAQKDPAIDHVLSQMSTGNTGNLFVALKQGKRDNADVVVDRLRKSLGHIPGVKVYMQSIQDVRVGGRSARTQYTYTLQDSNLTELNTWAPRMFDKLKTLPELRDFNTDQQTGGLELMVEIDRDLASRMGVSAQDVDNALGDAFGQRLVSIAYTQQNEYRTVIELDATRVKGPEILDEIWVHGTTGQIPLRAIAKWYSLPTTLSVQHQSQFAAVTFSFNTAPGVALGEAVDAVRRVESTVGLPASISAGFSGTAQAFRDSLASQPYLIAAALIIVYIVLGMLYESFIHPITILSTIPSAGLGALVALLITHTDLSVIGIIAIILLIGIVKKNAIMMIDFAIEAERDEHLSPEEAIYKACVLRFRPILMTTMAALLGAIPLAVGAGVGAEMRRPLGIAIVGGLILSQMLTLFTTPITYLFLDELRTRAKGWQWLAVGWIPVLPGLAIHDIVTPPSALAATTHLPRALWLGAAIFRYVAWFVIWHQVTHGKRWASTAMAIFLGVGAFVGLMVGVRTGLGVFQVLHAAWYVGVAWMITQSETVEKWMAERRAEREHR